MHAAAINPLEAARQQVPRLDDDDSRDDAVLEAVGDTTDEKKCECAVTVADEWQNRGLGVLLMRHLIEYARRQGFKRMLSIDAMDNEGMRDLASYLGFRRDLNSADSSQVVHTLDL